MPRENKPNPPRKYLVRAYKRLRQASVRRPGAYPVTVRQLEALIRLSEAVARIFLSATVKPEFVEYAFELIQFSQGEGVGEKIYELDSLIPAMLYCQKTCSICAIVIPVLGCVYVGVRRVCVLYLLACRSRRRRHVGRSDQSSICSFFFVFF